MTIAVLSWSARATLISTLESYRRFGLDELDEDRVIFFQQMVDDDRAIAEEYGYRCLGSALNLGIAGGYRQLLEAAQGDIFLFLENDWELIVDPKGQLGEASALLREGLADVVRFRHRERPGEPLYTRQFAGNEHIKPTHLLDSVHWCDAEFPEITLRDGWFWTTARYANWTNNPTMFRTDFLRDQIVPRMGNLDVEVDLQEWWEQQDFIVIQGKGLFTHNRLDR
ncbi:MAG: hypothetical protein WCJ13_05020 [Coriobacteriia bacterium]